MWSLQTHIHGVPSGSREMRLAAKTVPAGPLQQGVVRNEWLAQQGSRLHIRDRHACAVQAGDSSSNGYNNGGSCFSDQQQLQLQLDQKQQIHHADQLQQQQYTHHAQRAHAFLTAEPSSVNTDAVTVSIFCDGRRGHKVRSLDRSNAGTAAADGAVTGDVDMQPHRSAAVQMHTDHNPQQQQQQQQLLRQDTSNAMQDAAAVRANSSSTLDNAGYSRKQRRQQQHSKQADSGRRRHYGTSGSKSGRSSTSSEASSLHTSKLLTKAISSSASWQQLQHLLQQDGEHMNHIHACALLSTTSRLVQYSQLPLQEQQHFGDFYVAALQLAFARVQDSAGPREVSSMLWAVAKVGLHPGPAWLTAYLQAAMPHLDHMNAQDLGLLAWSLARFRHQPEPQWQQQLLHITQQRMHDLDPQGLCNLLWGLATLDIQPGHNWVAAAVAAAGSHMSSFQPQGLAVMLWAVARLGSRPDQSWLQDAAEAASRQLMQFKPAELAMLCHALTRMHYRPLLQQQQQEQQLLWQVQSVSHNRMQNLRFSEAANMLWALGVGGQQVQPVWLTAALQQLAATVQQADGKALANAVYGLAKLQHRPAQEWWEAIWQQLPFLLPVDANSAVSAATAAASNGVSTQGATAAAAAPQADNSSSSSSDGVQSPAVAAEIAADSQAQATLMLSIAKLRVAVPPHVAALLLQATQLQLQLHAMNSAEVCGLAIAVANLKLQVPQQWLAAVDDALEALLQSQLLQEQHAADVSCQRQQQPQWPEQQQQRGHDTPLQVQPMEVSNTLFSLARLRYIPSDRLLQAVQQYQQQYQQHLQEADRQQLSRALQSIAARQKHLQQQQQQQALAAAAEAVPSPLGTGEPGGSSSSTRREPDAVDAAAAAGVQTNGRANGTGHVSNSSRSSSSCWHNGSSSDDSWFEVGKYALHVHGREGSTVLQGSDAASSATGTDGQVFHGSHGVDAASCKALPVLLGGCL